MKTILIISIVVLLSPVHSFAVGEAAVPFLGIHPSPRLNGMAGAVTGIPMDDPYAVFFNPAQLGYFGQKQNLAIGTYLHKTDWLPTFGIENLTFNSSVFAAGYNFKNIFTDFSVSVAFSYMDTKLDLGENTWTDDEGQPLGTFSSDENYQMSSFGIGIDYWVDLYFGYSYKSIESNLAPTIISVGQEHGNGKAKGSATDYGLIFEIPFTNIFQRLYDADLFAAEWFAIDFSLSLGAAVLNSGDFIKYEASPSSDPLPKTAKMGWGIKLGLNGRDALKEISLCRFNWGTEARDELIENDDDYSWPYLEPKKYTDFPGNIKFWENAMRGKATGDISIYQGWQLGFFDSFEYSSGTWTGPGFERKLTSSGFMISTAGILIYLKNNNGGIFTWFADHMELQYQQSKYSDSHAGLDGTTFRGISFIIKGF